MDERAQLSLNGIQDDTNWLHDFRETSLVTITQTCSLNVSITSSWSNGSCNGPATPFKTTWTQNRFLGKLEAFKDISESDENPDCESRSIVVREAG